MNILEIKFSQLLLRRFVVVVWIFGITPKRYEFFAGLKDYIEPCWKYLQSLPHSRNHNIGLVQLEFSISISTLYYVRKFIHYSASFACGCEMGFYEGFHCGNGKLAENRYGFQLKSWYGKYSGWSYAESLRNFRIFSVFTAHFKFKIISLNSLKIVSIRK